MSVSPPHRCSAPTQPQSSDWASAATLMKFNSFDTLQRSMKLESYQIASSDQVWRQPRVAAIKSILQSSTAAATSATSGVCESVTPVNTSRTESTQREAAEGLYLQPPKRESSINEVRVKGEPQTPVFSQTCQVSGKRSNPLQYLNNFAFSSLRSARKSTFVYVLYEKNAFQRDKNEINEKTGKHRCTGS